LIARPSDAVKEGRVQALPFDKPGRFYRGNLHTHSTRSDGALSPAEAVDAYRARGYDFVAVTDHFSENYGFPITDTRESRRDGFTTIIGAELHGPRTEVGERWHLLAVGLPLDFAPPAANETGPALAARAAEAGAFVGLAHPAWYNLTLADALTVEAAHAVEVYNETCAQDNDRGESWHIADMLLARRRTLSAYAADDAHFRARPDAFAAWVQVKAERLAPEALVAALMAGHYYSSQGPAIHDVSIAAGQIAIACSPARLIVVSGRGAASRAARGDGLTECSLPLDPFLGAYCRVTVIDGDGKRAWSNPIWLD
jgi:predicted metal-dependent phosphoesterase TrpH